MNARKGKFPIMDKEPIEDILRGMKSELPAPRIYGTRDELNALIQRCGGPRSARDIRKARQDFKESRIPHIFSSLETQDVVDVLANDLDQLIAELLKKS